MYNYSNKLNAPALLETAGGVARRERTASSMGTLSIPLSEDKFVLIDEEDYGLISQYTWHPFQGGHTWYAVSYVNRCGIRQKFRMHRVLLNAPAKLQVDHINGNGLDNRRSNIRLATKVQNGWNRGKRAHSTSCFKGVTHRSDSGKWSAKIQQNNVVYRLGVFETEVEAARVYDDTARKLFGEYARLNFPVDDTQGEGGE